MTAAVVHYNTPKLTHAALLSLWLHTPECRVVVFDNSDMRPFADHNGQFLQDNAHRVTVIDNTHGQLIDFEAWLAGFPDREPSPGNNYGSAKHCRSVQWLCDELGEGFLLMDSDILLRRDVRPFFSHPDCAWVGEVGENVRRRFGYDFQKVQPFLCWLNVPLMRSHDISYFHPDWMWNLTTRRPNHRYDTGAWFHRAVREAGLPTCQLPLREYIIHLGHGSWRDRDAMAWLQRHRLLWDAGTAVCCP